MAIKVKLECRSENTERKHDGEGAKNIMEMERKHNGKGAK